MMKKVYSRLLHVFLVVILLLYIGGLTIVMAQPSQMVKESTLTKVLERNVLRVGVLTACPPWCYLDENYNNVGFDVDIAKLLAENLGVELELVETENVNRAPYIVTGKIDILIAVFGNTLDRAKSVAFSKPYAPYTLVVVGRKDDVDFKKWTDISSRKIAIGRASTADIILSKVAPEGTTIVRYDNPIDYVLALEQGKVDAFSDGYTNAAHIVQSHPKWEIKGDPYSRTFPCMAVQLGDQVWLNWVNLFIDHMLNEGKFQELWVKHFKVPWTEIWPSY